MEPVGLWLFDVTLEFAASHAIIDLGPQGRRKFASPQAWIELASDLSRCEQNGFLQIVVGERSTPSSSDAASCDQKALDRGLTGDVVAQFMAFPGRIIFAGSGQILGPIFEIAIASTARIGAQGTSLGFGSEMIGAYAPSDLSLMRLTSIVGLAQSNRMHLLGSALSARNAFACGLLDQIVDEDKLSSAATVLAGRR